PTRFRQVLVNLVGNAIKFTSTGEVLVRAHPESQLGDEMMLHVAVSDTGIGIAAEKRDRLFHAFEQVDSSMARRYGGTGLGLAISSRLVELQGGRIWYEARAERGSSFHFTSKVRVIPREPAEFVEDSGPLRNQAALVVDDNPSVRGILTQMLKSWDMQVAAVDSAAAALKTAATRKGAPFLLALVDGGLPDSSGFTLVKQLHQQFGLQVRHVVTMINSGDRSADASRAEQAGSDACISKPVSQSELFDALAELLPLRGSQPASLSPSLPAEAFELTGLRILLAEDSLYNQKLAVGLLEKRGHQVSVAGNGAEAVEQVSRGSFDLVLMDVQMPDVDGLEATRQIRALEEQTGDHVPIVAMTAQALQGDREKCLDAGMDDYLTKPVRSQQLYETIAAVLARLRPAAAEPYDPAQSTPVAETPSGQSGEIPQAATGTDLAGPAGAPPEPEAVEPQDEPVFSQVAWEGALRQVDGDPVLLQTVVAAFLEETPRRLEELSGALAEGRSDIVRRTAHTIKGGFRLFGAEEAYALAVELEGMGRQGDLSRAEASARRLRESTQALIRELSAFAKKAVVAHNA
ncbi:MAG: sensor histidine kinase, partial [Planctomycetaceae bacterium]